MHWIHSEVISVGFSARSGQPNGERPGDLFNAQTEWSDILEPHGWTRIGQHGEVVLWKRPGKRGCGYSATTNYAGADLFYVFSTNAHPFEPETAYTKFAAYALLSHRGDFTAAAKALHQLGYGDQHLVATRPYGLRVQGVTEIRRRIRTVPAKEVTIWRA